MEQPLLEIVGKLVAVLALVALNGFFVAAEFSLVAVRRTRIEHLANDGNIAAQQVRHSLDEIDNYIAATQVGITMASLGLGWVGEPAVAVLIEPLFAGLPSLWPQVSAHAVAVTIAFVTITALHIILGELVPKTIALQRAEPTALIVTGPLHLFAWLFGPFVRIMNGGGNGIVKLLGLRPATGHELAHNEDELRMLVSASQESGILQESEEEMLHKVFSFADKEAHQVMVPRTEIVTVPAEMTLQAFAEFVAAEHLHTRFPVYEGTLDSVVGIIHLKDVVTGLAGDQAMDTLRTVMRPVLVVPETIHIDELLRQLQRRRMHMAVLVDEYGGTAGLVTMEDLLEEIVGEIRDEFDIEEPGLSDHHDGTWSVDGMMSIDEFNERFGLNVSDPNYDTIAGYVLGQLGRVAEVGDEVTLDGLVLRVEEMDGRRIASLWVLPQPGRTLTVDDDDLTDDEAATDELTLPQAMTPAPHEHALPATPKPIGPRTGTEG